MSSISSLMGSYYSADYLLNSLSTSNSNSYNPLSSLGGLLSSYNNSSLQTQAQSLISDYKSNTAEIKNLKKETANFLTDYTNSMNSLNQAAGTLTNGGIDKLLVNSSGEVTDDTIKATVDAVQKMVDQFNDSLTLLNDNADRGSGVVSQIGRMVDDPIAKSSMDMLGVTMNDDGTMSLDTEVLQTALKDASEGTVIDGVNNQLNLIKDLIGGSNGLAANVQKDARAGLNTSASRLIGNDIANIQEKQQNRTSFFNDYLTYSRSGAYGLNNLAAMGIMMNMLV